MKVVFLYRRGRLNWKHKLKVMLDLYGKFTGVCLPASDNYWVRFSGRCIFFVHVLYLKKDHECFSYRPLAIFRIPFEFMTHLITITSSFTPFSLQRSKCFPFKDPEFYFILLRLKATAAAAPP